MMHLIFSLPDIKLRTTAWDLLNALYGEMNALYGDAYMNRYPYADFNDYCWVLWEVKNASRTKVVCIPICEGKFLERSQGCFTDYKI